MAVPRSTRVNFPYEVRCRGKRVPVAADQGWLIVGHGDWNVRAKLRSVCALEKTIVYPWGWLAAAAVLHVWAVVAYYRQDGAFAAMARALADAFGVEFHQVLIAAATLGGVFVATFILSIKTVLRLALDSGENLVLSGRPKHVAELYTFVWEYLTALTRQAQP